MSYPDANSGSAEPTQGPGFMQTFWKAWNIIPSMKSDALPPNGKQPRLESIAHIQEQIKDVDPTHGPTVGHGIIAGIEAIRTLCGEHGARDVDSVFTSKELTELYRRPLWDKTAHRRLAELEMKYWSSQNSRQSTSGSTAAMQFSVDERVTLQMGLGAALRATTVFSTGLERELQM
jgi:hypothetical protein